MEWIEGFDLERMLTFGPLNPNRVALLGLQICAALAKGHTQGIVHRDLKPANVMVVYDNEGRPRIKLLDYGIAKHPSARPITAPAAIVGTPRYMSPEQVRAWGVDHRSDIYSLGVVLYELVEGRPPFTGETLASLCFQICQDAPLPTVRAPAELAAIIERCLAKDPERRYSTVIELAAALLPWSEDPQAATVLWRMLWAIWHRTPNEHPSLRLAISNAETHVGLA